MSHLGHGASGVLEFTLYRALSDLIDQKRKVPLAHFGAVTSPFGSCSPQRRWRACAASVLVTYRSDLRGVLSQPFISVGSREQILLA